MSAPVFFHADAVAGSPTLTLEGDEGRHAVVVRRLRVGEAIELVDGAGGRAVGDVAAVGKQSLDVDVRSVQIEPRRSPRLVVVQALPKGDRGELAVEMLTEIGVDAVVPWAASRSVTVWKGANGLRRWRARAREAAKKSRRAWWPQVSELAATADVVELLAAACLPVVLHEAGSVPLSSLQLPSAGDIVIVVGPEGGISDEELAAFAASPVTLGPEVLRTSTAGVAAAAALLVRTSRWS